MNNGNNDARASHKKTKRRQEKVKKTTAKKDENKNVNQLDNVFDCFYHKYKTGIFAYDLPCQHLNTKKIELQCRSADELATTTFFCFDCETSIE